MLANLLVDKFETVLSIDWDQVIGHQEFSGHTKSSLGNLLHHYMMKTAAKHFKVHISSLTLKQIAEVARIMYSDRRSKVPDNLRKRQDVIIEYWLGLC